MAYTSEAQLEESLVQQLSDQGWELAKIKNDDELKQNFRHQFNKFNKKALKGNPLSDNEFRLLLAQIENQGVFASAKILRDQQTLSRDDNTTIHYSLFNKREWCRNHFQVTQQLKTSGNRYNTRYDVTLLINGLPLIQIELKKSGVEVKEAFNQIKRYKEDNAYKGLFNFLQFFIISNGEYTRYFANNENFTDSSFVFKWTNDKNEEYKSLSEFAMNFLDKCWSAKMISRYMIVQETTKNILIMRPYQVYGAERMITCATETKNNGFIWHTTGSGKTITSFKVSQLLAENPKFKKVFFLVDRRDLNTQTMQEFNQFKEGFITPSDNTRGLVKNIKSTKTEDKFILASIQKFSKALDERYSEVMDALKDENVVFIIDECHRTQFGEMQKRIRTHFSNAQYFGFTGTPRFVDNKSADGRTTADVFGSCLHTYLLKDGIRDKNTLPFSVEYVSTVKAKEDIEDPDREIKGLITDEVWHHPERVQAIAEDVIRDRQRKSHNKKFNAMMTVDSVKAVGLYMDAFTRVNNGLEKDQRLIVATVYSYTENEEREASQEYSKDLLGTYIADYNKVFGTNHSLADVQRYNTDVADRLKKGEIDILVVVQMMLTGFDSKLLNTLYVDRRFDNHTLVQAYSRTNRINGPTKPVGHIRCYRNLKEETDTAIKLFSNVKNADEVLALPFEEQKEEFEAVLADFLDRYPNPEELIEVESEIEKKDFVLSYRNLMRTLNKIKAFSDFSYDDFEIDEGTINSYQSHYLEFKSEAETGEKISVLGDIDFELETILSDTINVDYIYNLLNFLDVDDDFAMKKFRELVSRDGTDKLRRKKDLLFDFLDTALPQMAKGVNPFNEYMVFLEKKVGAVIEDRSEGFGITPDVFIDLLKTQRFRGRFDTGLFEQESTLSFKQKLTQVPVLKTLLNSLAEIFETDK